MGQKTEKGGGAPAGGKTHPASPIEWKEEEEGIRPP